MKAGAPFPCDALGRAFFGFCVVGGVGFLVDVSVLQVCLTLHLLGPVLGRLLSFSVAVLATFELNRRFVFHAAGRMSYLRRFLAYLTAQSGGLAINFMVYLAVLGLLKPPYGTPVTALVTASACALGCNFMTARVLVFR